MLAVCEQLEFDRLASGPSVGELNVRRSTPGNFTNPFSPEFENRFTTQCAFLRFNNLNTDFTDMAPLHGATNLAARLIPRSKTNIPAY